MRCAVSALLLLGALFHFAGPASSMTALIEQPRNCIASSEQRVRLADKRDYRHCHNFQVRTYRHKRDRLPQNWPPHSDTPRL